MDLIVSSSPYVTSYEYADLHQLSTIWLDFTEDLKQYRSQFIGSASRPKNHQILRSKIAKDITLEMKDKSEKLSQEIGSFYLDMEQIFDESYRILKQGGLCCFVIGNTSLKGVDILNAQIFVERVCNILDIPYSRSLSEKFLRRYFLKQGMIRRGDSHHHLRQLL